MSDVRRCRRCKRKRMDDEPPEVRLYKTCAKCRIIERQKKKLRKPLAEETMLYGMKQFQQQSQNGTLGADEIFMDDEIFDGKVKAQEMSAPTPSQQQFSLYKFLSAPTQSGSTPRHTPLSQQTARPSQPFYNSQIPLSHIDRSQQVDTVRLHLVQPANNVSMPVDKVSAAYKQPKSCEICSSKLDSNDDLSMSYNLCSKCYTNPYRLNNVFGNFDEFISQIQKNRNKNLENYVFVKELDNNFQGSLNLHSKNIANEKQYRDLLLENIRIIYLEPVIAAIVNKFNHVSTNTNDPNLLATNFRNVNSIKCWYKCYKDSQLKCNSSLYLNYNINFNLLIIKFNHQVHKLSRIYPENFIIVTEQIVDEMKEKTERAEVDYNFHTAHLVYEKLFSDLSKFNTDIQTFIKSLNKEDFINDFMNFKRLTEPDSSKVAKPLDSKKADEAKPENDAHDGVVHGNDVNGDEDDEEEEEEEEEEDEEDDEDSEEAHETQDGDTESESDNKQDQFGTEKDSEEGDRIQQRENVLSSSEIHSGITPSNAITPQNAVPSGANLDPVFNH
ncbi:uncharacterized protein PRCAT00004071001 [Priceomyces carsonii]|uniref:uncharacterized protein n=1 Tax=Priceomyces carsonii TaxID=28549 RepID=UPI002EDA511F|nr:unnamed protein product [Priceomyces carsonii]